MTAPIQMFDTAWYRDQIQRFRKIRSDYEALANCLLRVLQDFGMDRGILLIVQARAKDVASFAEKIQRPGKSYTEPLRQLSDLCGARVIAHTLADVESVCRFIEQHFAVLPEESDNAQDRLKAIEFGYLSRHFEARFKPGVFPESIVPGKLVALGCKFEIQVRTILQHAWADIAHEASYKSSFKLPSPWVRELARLAAVLEATDVAFDRLQSGLKEYAASYGSYCGADELRHEMDKATIALEADPANAVVAHRLARMAMSLEDWDRAIGVLKPFAEAGNARVLRDLGVSVCKRYAREPEGEDYAAGQSFLANATTLDGTDVDAWASLAGTWRTRQHAALDADCAKAYRDQAHALYRKAFDVDPTDPYALGNFVEYEVAEHPDLDLMPYLRSALQQAVHRCRRQAEVGVNMPWAYFDLGKFQMLMGEPFAALTGYAKGVVSSSAAFFIESALRSFRELRPAQARLPGFDWIEGFLRFACAIRFGAAKPVAAGEQSTLPLGPVVIIAGYTATAPTDAHRTLLREAFAGYRGTIVSGGTEAGVCALVGELQATCPGVHTVGYLPEQIPAGVTLDRRYRDLHRSVGADDFTPLEALLYWRDLHAAGLVGQTRFIALGGGRIAGTECSIALAMGVPVAVVAEVGGEPAALVSDRFWAANPLLHAMPADATRLRAFLGGQCESRVSDS